MGVECGCVALVNPHRVRVVAAVAEQCWSLACDLFRESRRGDALPTSPKILLDMIWNHPANRGVGRARALVKAAVWQGYKRAARSRPYTIKVYDGMRFQAYPDSTQPGRFLYFGGYPDFEEMTFMQRYLRPGDGFIDGGANEGMFALLAAKLVGPEGDVHAFEAVPTFLDRLRENVAANGLVCVTIHDKAIGRDRGDVSFAVRGVGSRIQTPQDAGTKTVTATVVTLDEVLPDRQWAMGKLDIEGAEHLALEGASGLLAAGNPPIWMMELTDRGLRRFHSSEREFRAWIGDHGFETVLYDVERNALVPAPFPIWPLADLMLVSRERRGEVEARLR